VGIDLGTFEEYLLDKTAQENSKMALQVNHAKFVLGYVGRPVERKGFHLLLKAWQRSKLDPDKNVLLIAGCTREECEKILGYPVSNIHGLGYLGNLREFYAACDAITLPSQHEGFGYALLEGAAAGKPLLGSDIPGIRCAIQHNRTGLLVPVNDEIALADAIQKLANDRDLRVTLGKNARIHAEQEFSREMVLSKFLDFYRDLLKVD
jgi:N,N'-diacetylbacillosaminyl-diphospho-undecaprenol alpha-1,3-N-acetylgalactosaminyltransferase